MRKWTVALLILSSLLSGCIGFGFRGGGAGAITIIITIGARRGLAERLSAVRAVHASAQGTGP